MRNIKKTIQVKMATMTTLPLPATLVSSIGKDEKPNVLVITYVTGVNEEPPMFGIAVRPDKFSNSLIKESGEFVINVPTLELMQKIDYCGTHSGRKVNKFKKLGLTSVKAKNLTTPLIAECPINIECKLRQTVKLPSHNLFIGEVVALSVNEDVVSNKKNSFGIMLPKFDQLNFLFTTFLDYRVIGEKKGRAFEEHKKICCKGSNCLKGKEGVCQKD